MIHLLGRLGGDINIDDSYLGSTKFNDILADLPPVKLALNCVGGECATDILRTLAPGGTMVTYGGMSKRPLVLPMDLIACKQLQLKGFWITHWNATHSSSERLAMINEIAEMVKAEELTLFYELHDFDDFNYALKSSMEPYRLRKVVLNMDYPDRLAEHDSMDPREYDA